MSNAHSQRLETYVGKENIEMISAAMRGFYWPIPVANTPGIWAMPDGDFRGDMPLGQEGCLRQRVFDNVQVALKRRRARVAQRRRQFGGFTSLADLMNEMTVNGKGQFFMIGKAGATGVANIANSLWDVGSAPQAGSVTAATEVVPTNTTAGGLLQQNAAGGDTLHFISATIGATVNAQTLLMYDLFQYYTHNIATQNISSLGASVTRYQSTAARGTFLSAFVTSALGGTVGNYQLTYQDQDGNTAEAATTQALVSGAIARRFPFATSVGNGWFIPLNSPDNGIRKFTAITQSVATGTGNIMVAACKPLVWIPCVSANIPVIVGGADAGLNYVQIVDNACLSFMEINKSATTATNYNGQIVLCSG